MQKKEGNGSTLTDMACGMLPTDAAIVKNRGRAPASV